MDALINVKAFQKLREWGIAISIEVGAVKEWGCGKQEFADTDKAIRNIQISGGTVDILAMDEPYIGGELVANGRTCKFNMNQSASATARFIKQVNRAYPRILIGDVEPYPYFSIDELEKWILTLKDRGVTLAFFHLDVDMVAARSEGRDVPGDLKKLSQFLKDHQIPFGVIFTSNSNWEASSDRAFSDSTMKWISTVNAAIGKPQHVIFQSWLRPSASGIQYPFNLPENSSEGYSFTQLVIEGLDVFSR